jgi:hypothetical protein
LKGFSLPDFPDIPSLTLPSFELPKLEIPTISLSNPCKDIEGSLDSIMGDIGDLIDTTKTIDGFISNPVNSAKDLIS